MADRELRGDFDFPLEGDEVGNWSARLAPGKVTLTSKIVPVRRDAAGGTVGAGAADAVARSAESPSQSLPDPLRTRLEAALGTDLGGVRVHTGKASEGAARDLSANAYAQGQDIHFGSGKYDPDSESGQRLIAHEVAHTVQQRGAAEPGTQAKLEVSSPGDAHEEEAERFAQSFGTASELGSESGHATGLSVAGRPAVVTPVATGAVSRAMIQRDGPPAPAGPAGPAPAGPAARVETVTFEPTFTIVPGGLAPGVERTQDKVFRGDTLRFHATLEGLDGPLLLGMAGRVVGSAPATHTRTGNVVEWSVVVGGMGIPARPGQAPEPVDATPFVELTPPRVDAGRRFSRTFAFRVVADLVWLSDRADIASGECAAAYYGLLASINQAYVPYKAAHVAHKLALTNRDQRAQLARDIALGILFAGVGGAAGGIAQQLVRGSSSSLVRIAGGTAVGDIAKYAVRLGRMAGGPGGSAADPNTTDTPSGSPTSALGSADGGAGFEPDVWKATVQASLNAEAQAVTSAAVGLKRALSEAWAAGRTDLMDQDPVDILAPYRVALDATRVPVRTQREYANDLWFEWIRLYGITVVENSLGQRQVRDQVGGKLEDDIRDQCGSGADHMIAVLRRAAHERAIYGDGPGYPR